MKTADYALIVSIFSAVLALVSLGWNIWSKFIYPTGRLRIAWQAITLVDQAAPHDRPRYLAMNITNHGPSETTIHSANGKFARPWPKRGQFGLINPIHDLRMPELAMGPFAGGLPKKLAVGETFSLYFPFAADSFARDPIIRLGVSDVFGKFHGAPRRHIKAVAAELGKAFPDIPPPRYMERE